MLPAATPTLEIAVILVVLVVLALVLWAGRKRAPDLGEISQQWLVQHRAHERDPRAY